MATAIYIYILSIPHQPANYWYNNKILLVLFRCEVCACSLKLFNHYAVNLYFIYLTYFTLCYITLNCALNTEYVNFWILFLEEVLMFSGMPFLKKYVYTLVIPFCSDGAFLFPNKD